MDSDVLQGVGVEVGNLPNQPETLLSSSPNRPLIHAGQVSIPKQYDGHHAGKSIPAMNTPSSANSSQAGAVIAIIEDIFEAITDCIIGEKKELVIRLKSRRRPKTKALDAVSGVIGSLPDLQTRIVKFPSRNPQEAWKFAALFRILELTHEALVDGVVTTKRDIYYRDPDLFLQQAVVDRYVNDIAYTFGVERDALNVVAAAKGLIAGAFVAKRKDGSAVDFTFEAGGMLVPNAKDILHVQLEEVRWILVIEKEATFRTLATSQYWRDSAAGKGIVITAKGYPDILTRMFLKLLSAQSTVPILALVDYDPDGIAIMSTYKYGSMALAHENANLAVPSIQWLGVRCCDVTSASQGLLKLTARDRRTATRMLEKEIIEEGGREAEWRRELQAMLFLNVKAEIQILGNGEALVAWLDAKLRACM